MKIKKGFMLCPTMGKTMVIATGELEKSFSGMIKMNKTATAVWNWIEEGKELEDIYLLYAHTFGVDDTIARSDVDSVVEKMTREGIFE